MNVLKLLYLIKQLLVITVLKIEYPRGAGGTFECYSLKPYKKSIFQ